VIRLSENDRAGLCASCEHARIIESSKGATFIRCELSFSDPRFARYPRLPVVHCEGYASRAGFERGS
jgi:hypothetical protein